MLTQLHQLLDAAINGVNALLWNYVLVALLVLSGIYFTVRFRFVQVRLLGQSLRQVVAKAPTDGGISGFQAFTIGLASRVGTGNIAGVAVALTVGGPGAIFWMWVISLFGMASAFVESTLAQIFKVRHRDGSFRGGPAYYIQTGLGSKKIAVLFSCSLILAFGFVFNAVQAHSIGEAFESSFGWDPLYVGIGLGLMTLPILFRGMRGAARISAIMVPLMAIGYLLMAAYVIVINFALIPEALGLIVKSAFGPQQAAGGFAGYAFGAAVLTGVKRGLFTNEAGMGSAPNAAATASSRHPAQQGLLQMLGVSIDTHLICTATALIILLSGQYTAGTGIQGSALTQSAIASQVGSWGGIFMAVAIFFFAYASVIGNYVYAESNFEFLTKNRTAMTVFRLFVAAMVAFGTVGSLATIWNLADVSMGLMTIINLVAICLLGKYALAALTDYKRRLKPGAEEPLFTRDTIPALTHLLPSDVWGRKPVAPPAERKITQPVAVVEA
ncbi:MAG: sodium:alanine symporter family protein [Rariglobus sp.]